MKLLYLMTEPLGIGGVQSDMLTLSEDLTKRGHRIYIAAMPGVLLEEIKSKGARHVEIDFMYHDAGGFIQASRALRRFVREEGIEIVAPQSVRSTIAAYAALRAWPYGYRVAATRRRVPIITTIHNIHNPRHFGYVGHILRTCTDHVIFESNYERNRVIAGGLPEGQSSVIHSGIDIEHFVPGRRAPAVEAEHGLVPGRDFVFGIVARLSEEKGHQYLVRAFQKVKSQVPNARLLIVGDGPLLQDVKQQVADLKLGESVIFAGLRRNVPDYLAVMDVFVLSSTRESFPLAAREAMAAGKAVIAPRIGGCGEVVDDPVTGYLFESANVEDLAKQMLRAASNNAHQTLGVAARARVERLFSRRAWVDGDEKAYLQWMAAAPPARA